MTLREYIKQAASKKDDGECETPGKKIRSKGKGRGAARGRGHGPLGVPIGDEAMVGEEKTALDIAYEEGVQAALKDFQKEAQGISSPGGGYGALMNRGAPAKFQSQAVAGPASKMNVAGGIPKIPMTMQGGGGGGAGAGAVSPGAVAAAQPGRGAQSG